MPAIRMNVPSPLAPETPSTIEYRTVFDLGRDYSPDWSPLMGCMVFLTLGIFLIYESRYARRTALKALGWVFAISGAIVWPMSFVNSLSRHEHLLAESQRGHFPIVQGQVKDFKPIPANGVGWERFSVQGTNFAYYDSGPKNGFHRTRRNGGPIREGLPVRIAYTPGKPNEILRLEIPNNEPYHPPQRESSQWQSWATPLLFLSACVIWLWMNNRLWMPFDDKDIIFRESMISGNSLDNWLKRLGGAHNAMLVALTKDTLHVDAILPFRLFVPLEIWGCNHRVLIKNILKLEKKDRSWPRWTGALPELDIEYNDASGNTHAFALYLVGRDELFDKLQKLRQGPQFY